MTEVAEKVPDAEVRADEPAAELDRRIPVETWTLRSGRTIEIRPAGITTLKVLFGFIPIVTAGEVLKSEEEPPDEESDPKAPRTIKGSELSENLDMMIQIACLCAVRPRLVTDWREVGEGVMHIDELPIPDSVELGQRLIAPLQNANSLIRPTQATTPGS